MFQVVFKCIHEELRVNKFISADLKFGSRKIVKAWFKKMSVFFFVYYEHEIKMMKQAMEYFNLNTMSLSVYFWLMMLLLRYDTAWYQNVLSGINSDRSFKYILDYLVNILVNDGTHPSPRAESIALYNPFSFYFYMYPK